MSDLIERFELIKKMVSEQAEDDGIWFVPETITEDYLQKELRRLHNLIDTGVYMVRKN